jgi:hypothetical protein
MNRVAVLDEITRLETHHCQTCKIHNFISGEHSGHNANLYCLRICKIGDQLRRLGADLQAKPARRGEHKYHKYDAKDYRGLCRSGYTDIEITRIWGIGRRTLVRWKKERWNLRAET